MKDLQNEISSFKTEAATMVKYNRSCFGQTALKNLGLFSSHFPSYFTHINADFCRIYGVFFC